MADYNSSLPVIGSQTITNVVGVSGELFQDILGSVAISTSPVQVSGNITITDDSYINIAASGNFIPVSGDIGVVFSDDYVGVIQSGTPWEVSGTSNVLGSVAISTSPVEISGNVTVSDDSYMNVAVSGTSLSTSVGVRGATVQDYDTSASLAAAGSHIHYYTSTGSFYLEKVYATMSGKGKIEIGTGSEEAGPTAIKAVVFNSTADPNMVVDFGANAILIGSNTDCAVVRWNRESTQAQDVYSTIVGFTV